MAQTKITINELDNTSGAIAGAWNTWTPTWANLTVGNGTVDAHYTQIGKTVIGRLSFTMGSTSAMGSAPTFTPPVTPNSEYINTNQRTYIVGNIHIEDNATAGYIGFLRMQGSPVVLMIGVNTVSGALSTTGTVNATTPMTWATGDYFYVTFAYEAA